MATTTRAISNESVDAAGDGRKPPGHTPSAARRRRRPRLATSIRNAATALGAVTLVAVLVGATLDIAAIDRTSGGYEPPYTGYSGDPIDWDADTYTTPTGMVATGYVLDVYTDCTTGMISFDVLGLVTFDYRTVSERALAIHQPDEACRQRGFEPTF